MLTAIQAFDGALDIERAIKTMLFQQGIAYKSTSDCSGNVVIESETQGAAYYVVEVEQHCLIENRFIITYKDYSGDEDCITDIETEAELQALINVLA